MRVGPVGADATPWAAESAINGENARSVGPRVTTKAPELPVGIGAEAIDRHHHRHAELLQIIEMASKVGKAALERSDVFLPERIACCAAMHS